ncbi:MAG TPA: SGNH/GDSL hydrolase family protein [Gaiellaceae bacterium]|jgi:lysophospholipase L1-like esterase
MIVATLGDSITEGSPLLHRTKGGNPRSSWQYWAARADPSLEFRVSGVYGERTDQIAERLEECAHGADVLIVQGGINDIAQGRSVVEAADELRAMIGRGNELVQRVITVDVLPWNNGYPAAEPEIRRLNELIRELAAAESVAVLPFHDTLEDPERPGRMRSEWTDDGDHPSIAGYRRLGELAFRL